MKDEEFVFRADSREKAITARSAKRTRTHCGKGGRVRLPHDNLSKKELKKMSGECKSYRLNEPMTREEFMSMPDDLKITYIKAVRNKYGTPDSHLGKAMGFAQQSFAKLVKRLDLCKGKEAGGHVKWDKEGFFAWWNGVDKLPEPVHEEPAIEEPEIFVEDDLPFEEPEPALIEQEKEIGFLNAQIDGLRKANEALMAAVEKAEAENDWLRKECDSLRMNARILEAQMEVVRMIFGGKNNA